MERCGGPTAAAVELLGLLIGLQVLFAALELP